MYCVYIYINIQVVHLIILRMRSSLQYDDTRVGREGRGPSKKKKITNRNNNHNNKIMK